MKRTRMRIGVIRKRRRVVEKFLKRDITVILANGLDVNGYGWVNGPRTQLLFVGHARIFFMRFMVVFGWAEGLLVEHTVCFCYVEVKVCGRFLLTQIPSMQKPRNMFLSEPGIRDRARFDNKREKIYEEERTINRLLMHYRMKQVVAATLLRLTCRNAARTPQQITLPRSPSPPTLPSGQPQHTFWPRRLYNRPHSSRAERHVHSKLPDYDDLAARLASLQGS